MKLPVTVIVPTRNCRPALERHLDAVSGVLPGVQQVIAIDSDSTDGTLELLHERLARIGATFVSHPPGLYESWNAACRMASAPWIYFSTVGDAIDPDGLEQLLSVGERFDADVVVSPPRMMQEDGSTAAGKRWPIHDMCDAVGEDAPARLLSRLETVMALCSFGSGSLLGSSAANLYRTSSLQQRPFPVDFGHAGDTAWALQGCATLRLALLPRAVSIFCLGWQFKESDPRQQRDLFLRLSGEAARALDAAPGDSELRLAAGWQRALVAQQEVFWDWLVNQADLVRDHADLRAYLDQVEGEKARTLRARIKRWLGRP